MFWICNELADHGLNDSNVAIEKTSEDTTNKGHPEVRSEADAEEGDTGAEAS